MTAAPYVPETRSLRVLADAVQACRGCELYRGTTQAVFGDGARRAATMVVGEQPGEREDLAGEPFVGPAGKVLDRALGDAGFDRRSVWLTNVVKHFAFRRQQGSKRRIHRKPGRTEIVACRPWLDAELRVVRPSLVVCLGATAAQALLGSSFRVSRRRGELITAELGEPPRSVDVVATVHPSAVLRSDDRKRAYAALVDDLRVARAAAG